MSEYPKTFTFDDGTSMTINSAEEAADFYRQLSEAKRVAASLPTDQIDSLRQRSQHLRRGADEIQNQQFSVKEERSWLQKSIDWIRGRDPESMTVEQMAEQGKDAAGIAQVGAGMKIGRAAADIAATAGEKSLN